MRGSFPVFRFFKIKSFSCCKNTFLRLYKRKTSDTRKKRRRPAEDEEEETEEEEVVGEVVQLYEKAFESTTRLTKGGAMRVRLFPASFSLILGLYWVGESNGVGAFIDKVKSETFSALAPLLRKRSLILLI